jgi:hypothetical protein
VTIATLAWGAAPAGATTQIFNYTGGEQTFVVPAGVSTLHVVLISGRGGTSGTAAGGGAAEVIGDLSVTPGQTLYIEVGGNGKDTGEGGAGGFNGGGNGAGGGGGASDIRTAPRTTGLAPDLRLAVAAGGGGGGSDGFTGSGGAGGAAGSAGSEAEGSGNAGGGAGTATEGGAGGFGCNQNGVNGQLGVGGAGGTSESVGPGGGGGGGYYGGGGGGGSCHAGSGGGGGGSSLVPVGGSVALASLLAVPKVELTYTAVSQPLPPPPGTFLGFHPKKKIVTTKKKVKVKFTFSADASGTTFKCKLDKGSFASCTSPKTYKVKPGKHKFSVAASGPGGTDPTPASFSFKVVKKAQ